MYTYASKCSHPPLFRKDNDPLLVKKRCLLKWPTTDQFGLTSKALPQDVTAMSGIYIDDFLTTGPPKLVQDFTDTLRRQWKTSEPQYLSPSVDLTFLGVTVKMTPYGLLLHQHNYTEELFREHSAHIAARKRMTSGEPDHFRKEDPLPPNPSNPDHQEWIKRGQGSWVDWYGFLPGLGQTWFLPSPRGERAQ